MSWKLGYRRPKVIFTCCFQSTSLDMSKAWGFLLFTYSKTEYDRIYGIYIARGKDMFRYKVDAGCLWFGWLLKEIDSKSTRPQLHKLDVHDCSFFRWHDIIIPTAMSWNSCRPRKWPGSAIIMLLIYSRSKLQAHGWCVVFVRWYE